MNFIERLESAVNKNNSLLCIGLDSDVAKIPKHLVDQPHPLFSFNRAIIDATHDLVCCYKPNIAYYEAQGTKGMRSLRYTIDYLHEKYPDIPIIIDAKRGDIGESDRQYAKAVFEYIGADAVTVNPYLGLDSLEPFLTYKDKGVIILCRTSNSGAVDFQDIRVKNMKLYEYVAKSAAKWNKQYGNCLLVVGATWPEQMKRIREIAKNMWFLVPGVGAQGGDIKNILATGLRNDKSGIIINSSRSIIYAGSGKTFPHDARTEAEKIRDTINSYR